MIGRLVYDATRSYARAQTRNLSRINSVGSDYDDGWIMALVIVGFICLAIWQGLVWVWETHPYVLATSLGVSTYLLMRTTVRWLMRARTPHQTLMDWLLTQSPRSYLTDEVRLMRKQMLSVASSSGVCVLIGGGINGDHGALLGGLFAGVITGSFAIFTWTPYLWHTTIARMRNWAVTV